jgi:hypothetical protein
LRVFYPLRLYNLASPKKRNHFFRAKKKKKEKRKNQRKDKVKEKIIINHMQYANNSYFTRGGKTQNFIPDKEKPNAHKAHPAHESNNNYCGR